MSGNPFAKLSEIKHSLPRFRPQGPRRARLPPQARPPSKPPAPPEPPSDEELFLMAMDEEGVEPLEFPGVHVPDPPRPDSFTRLPAPPNDDAWALARLTELVSGAGDFDLSFTDEYQEGHKKNVNPSILLNLREGLFPIQAHLDLHGLTLPEAQARLAADIPRFADMGYKTILVIHGKGLGSPDGIPVLKNNLANLLLRTSIRKHILAFVTARPSDGGAGACYVLLHRKPKSARRR